MKIAFIGSSLVSALWNGAATYYRGILRALAQRGHDITFYEPDAFGRQEHRDIEDPDWCRVRVWAPTREGALRAVDEARGADLVVKASGVGAQDELLEEAVLELQSPRRLVAFWDVDAPATLARVERDPDDPFRVLIPRYDFIFTYGGGPPIVRGYEALGAGFCLPVYNAVDGETHHPVPPREEFRATLSFLGNRLPDREERVEEFFLKAAERMPGERFLLGGSGWSDRRLPDNVRYIGHVFTHEHNAFNVSPLAVLNVCRQSMAEIGYSPATRVFEAAGAGACLVSDAWEGIERFLEPDREVLVARSGEEVAGHLDELAPERARRIGEAARRRVLAEHTYARRAEEVSRVLGERRPPAPRTRERLRFVFLGLSITSSWGNGHATTYRSLVRELARRGHDVLFLERDVPWYADNRDLPNPPYGRTALYRSLAELESRFAGAVAEADLVVLGSYVPEGAAVGDWILETAPDRAAFYDIDTPVTLDALERGACDYLRRDQVPRYALYLSFTGGPSLTRIERDLGSSCARALYCSADPDFHRPVARETRWDLSYMGTYSEDRQPPLERLLLAPARRLEERRFAVAGPQYPPEIEWPPNVDRIEHLSPPEHPGFYGASRMTLNLTRRDMARAGYSPSVRLFEAAACGTPIASDVWDGIETLLEPEREIFLVREAEEVVELLRPEAARRVAAAGERARRRVLAEHTPRHRAAELERLALGLTGSPRRRCA